ncbi:MAG: glycosyltransferase family protein [Verrucomicrobia bacterium]|nr:glycosyltransferase family protein [Verrucomicrobiota bacterium]MBS0637446.1 glycosyltransferase family protein [Verrucomicrobiota bacterium]
MPCMIVVQARLGSTRLPGKIFKRVLDKTLLAYQLERLRMVQNVAGIVVATTINPNDQPIVDWCNQEGYHCIRGSEDDVLSRYMAAIDAFGLDAVVRVTSDCPLIDPDLLERGLGLFYSHYNDLDYLSICHERSYPLGMDFEIVRTQALEKAYFEAKSSPEKEHVTPYIWQHPEWFRLANLQQKENQSAYRLTVDTEEDFALIRHIIEALYPKNPEFRLADIMALLQKNPDWLKINAHIPQKGVS